MKNKNISESSPVNKPNNIVVLIHGLHQRHWIMKPLANRIQKAGYNTLCFDYHSLAENIEKHSNELNTWLTKKIPENTKIHFVAHSLGGLVMRDFIARFPKWHNNKQIACCVNLGTPHNGSVTADYIKNIAPFAIGKSYEGALDGKTPALPDDIVLGIIAGNKPQGLGKPVLSYHNKFGNSLDNNAQKIDNDKKMNDGTVYISETKLINASAHIVLPVTHTGMLINKEVASQTIYFLQHQEFMN